MKAAAFIGAIGVIGLAACVPDQNRFRPLMEPERVQATSSSDAFVNTFLRVCLDDVGRASNHLAAAKANGLTNIGQLGTESFIANDAGDTVAATLIAEPTKYRCSLDDLSQTRGAATVAAFQTAIRQAGATPVSGNRFQISVKPILNSGDVLFYDLTSVNSNGSLSLILENQS